MELLEIKQKKNYTQNLEQFLCKKFLNFFSYESVNRIIDILNEEQDEVILCHATAALGEQKFLFLNFFN